MIISISLTKITQLQYLPNLPAVVNLLEIRADVFEADFSMIKKLTNRRLLFSLKSQVEGGLFTGSQKQRIQRIITASCDYDLIALEGERDLISEILRVVPVEKRVITWQGEAESYDVLKQRFCRYVETPAKYYRLITEVNQSGDELPIVQLLKNIDRRDLIVYAVGKVGIWTQVLAPFLGSPLVPTCFGDNENHLSPQALIEDYNLPHVYSVKKIFGIVSHSSARYISSKLHNQFYQKLKLPYLYLPFCVHSLHNFFEKVVNNKVISLNFAGFTIISPFKEDCLQVADMNDDPDVAISKAANMIVKREEIGWMALSTDALGTIDALNKITMYWQHKSIAVIGCGGAGRTVASALKRMGIKITLVNRSIDKGLHIANNIGVSFKTLATFNPALFDIIIHATPVGKREKEVPFDVKKLNFYSIVIDYVYTLNSKTALVKYCHLHNIKVVDGKEIARLQINHQFKIMTGI